MRQVLYVEAEQLTLSEALSAIENEECIAALIENSGFYLRIDEYSPVICTAIHNGHNLRPELLKNCLLSPEERFYEEDPYTDEFISSFPIQLVGNDSRFEYDLNRPMNQSTYFKSAWEKQVWKRKLSLRQRDNSHQKHKAFYLVVEALVTKLESLFRGCIVFDIHSYNYQRHQKDTPTFNVGTEQIDLQRWSTIVKSYVAQLDAINLPNLETRAAENELFYGRGYLIAHINARFDDTLVLPTEVKKVFMDETSGDPFPIVLQELSAAFRHVIADTSAKFMQKHTRNIASQEIKPHTLSGLLAPSVLEVDQRLFQLCRGLDVLSYINPVNFPAEKKRFFERKGQYTPQFNYRQIDVDPFRLKTQLYQLPVHKIEDIAMQTFFQEVIEDINLRISMLSGIGTEQFTLDSQRYFGKPDMQLLRRAEFIANAPEPQSEESEPLINADEAITLLQQRVKDIGLPCKIEKSRKLIAKMMVEQERFRVVFDAKTDFTQAELNSLVNNQLQVQMQATINAHQQPLKVFALGLPGYNRTMEGLGIYQEYITGSLPLSRLKTLAYRVLATQQMLNHNCFRKTWQYLTEQFNLMPETAFTIASRVYRGGGNTKDFHYLAGLSDMLNLPKGFNKALLMSGKVGLSGYHYLEEFLVRGFLNKPDRINICDDSPMETKDEIGFLIHSLKASPDI